MRPRYAARKSDCQGWLLNLTTAAHNLPAITLTALENRDLEEQLAVLGRYGVMSRAEDLRDAAAVLMWLAERAEADA